MVTVQCSGPSMEPTIVSDDIIFSERVSRHCYNIKKWDEFGAHVTLTERRPH